MAFNKKETLEGNIRAIKIALELEKRGGKPTKEELDILKAYKGFGGLKCVLLPTHIPNAQELFPKGEQYLFPLVRELNDLISSSFPTREAMEIRQSLKRSVTTAFYTPQAISESIAGALEALGLTQGVKRILDPSAGLGAYSNPYEGAEVSIDAYEKDRLTGLILKHVKAGNPKYQVVIDGFEAMRPIQMNSYDLVVSNIPFGNILVYDKEYDRLKGSVEKESQRAIHDYFFVKGLNALRRGGTLAFITSRGSMDAPSSGGVRRYLMERAELVSAVRLPDGLFQDEAGTEAGSDLIILRRRGEDKGQEAWTEAERDFVETETKNGISLNRYFSRRSEKILSDEITLGKNQFGKPAFKYKFGGNEETLAEELRAVILIPEREIGQTISEQPKVSQEASSSLSEVSPNVSEIHAQEIGKSRARKEKSLGKRSTTFPEEVQEVSERLLTLFAQVVQGQLGVEEAHDLFQGLISEVQHQIASLPSQEATPSEDLRSFDAERLFSHPRTASNVSLYLLEQALGGGDTTLTSSEGIVGLHALVRAKSDGGWEGLDVSMQEAGLSLAHLAYEHYSRDKEDVASLGETLIKADFLSGIYDHKTPKDYQKVFIDLVREMSIHPDSSSETMKGYATRLTKLLEDAGSPHRLSASSQRQDPTLTTEPPIGDTSPQQALAPSAPQIEKRTKASPKTERMASPSLFDEVAVDTEGLAPQRESIKSEGKTQKPVPTETNNAPVEGAPLKVEGLLDGRHATGKKRKRGGIDFSGRHFDLTERPIREGDLEPHHFEGSLVMLPSEEAGREPYIGFLRTNAWGAHFLEAVNPEGVKTYYAHVFKDKSKEPKERVRTTPVDWDRLVAYLKVRDAYHRLYRRDAEEMDWEASSPEAERQREELNHLYYAFYKEYGVFNNEENEKYLRLDPHFSEVKALGWQISKDDETYQKADIFFRSTLRLYDRTPPKVSSTTDALSVSLDRLGVVDLAFMQSLLPEKGEGELREELEGRIFYDHESKSYRMREHIICGNVVAKIDQLTKYLEGDPADAEEANKTLQALHEVRPATIAFEDIGLQLGERWMPTSLFEEYFVRRFDFRGFRLIYNKEVDAFEFQRSRYDSPINANRAWGVDKLSIYDIATHALQDTVPTFLKEVEVLDPATGEMKRKKVVDHVKTNLAQERIQNLRDGFEEFLHSQPKSVKDKLEELYNKRFNCYVRPEYDGSHQRFPGLDFERLGWSDLYQSQKDAIWMLVSNGGGVVDHEVGGGKTAIMCCAAHEMKRLGKCKKPLMIGLKANCEEIARQFKKSYPNARVLYATEDDLSPSNRMTFINKVKAFEWDCVIMTHEQFGKIPQALDVQEQFLIEEKEALERSITFLRNQGMLGGRSGEKQAYARIERMKERLERDLARLQDKRAEQTDKVVDFSALGFDHIFVDESHKFKNLSFQSRHANVSGLGSVGKGSDRADNLLFAIRSIQQRTGKDLGATFLSGTTISNSISELYLIFKFLRPNTLREAGLDSFDAWASVFAKKTVDFEFTLTGEVKQKERFRTFCKVPELTTLYREICDFRRAEDIGLDRPKANIQLVNLKPTEDQLDFGEKLIRFVKNGDHAGLGLNKPNRDSYSKSAALMATNYGRLMGVDMRLLDPERYDDHPDNKASACAHRLAEIWERTKEHKGTQFVFTNVGVYKPGNTGSFDVCSEIKRKLVEDYNIPSKEIAFMSDGTNEDKRKSIISAMNRGEVRILFGSTEKLGTGVNAQERAVAVHHLDIPYVPSAMEQRNGRAVRTGNWVAKEHYGNKVDIFCYAHERTIEAALFQLLDVKATFIEQIKTGKTGVRIIRDDMDENNQALGYAEIVAAISGDNTLLEKAKLDQKILRLESSQRGHRNVVYKAREEVERLETEIRKLEEKLPQIRRDLKRFQALSAPDEKGYLRVKEEYATPSLIGLPEGASKKEIVDRLQKHSEELNTRGKDVTIGNLGDFPLVIITKTVYDEFFRPASKKNEFYLKAESGLLSPNRGQLFSTMEANITYFARAIEKLPKIEADFTKRLEVAKEQLPVQKEIASKTWKHQEELDEARAQLRVLQARLSGQAEDLDQEASHAIKPPKPRL